VKEQREGILLKHAVQRLSEKQVLQIDETSRILLEREGIISYNPRAAQQFKRAGATVIEEGDGLKVLLPSTVIDKALATAPSRVVLGAREPNNRIVLDAKEPRVRFGSGSETNVWLDVSYEENRPKFSRETGNLSRLCQAAHLCEYLENLDFFIRCVNIQDSEITTRNKDVNKFLASLNHTTKHVQGGLTDLQQLDSVLEMASMICGGPDAFQENPILSFIACVVKSPLQIVEDTAETFMEITKRRIPIVVSSCPMGGATGPFDEFGMVALIHAELLAAITLHQLISPGAPVLYGAVPVRTRLDNLNDMYGAPEFIHYNMDCAQMARLYGLPCYSTAGVADSSYPGIQATVEKMMTLASIPASGAQYIHYAFGLLERTNVFCPEQAVLDDLQIGVVKRMLREPSITGKSPDEFLSMMHEVMSSSHRTFLYHLPLPSREDVYVRFPLEDPEGDTLRAAHEKVRNLSERPHKHLPGGLLRDLEARIDGILTAALSEDGS